MKSFGITDKGKVRSENQDSYIIENCDKRKCVIAVICDGMGGAKAGDLASRLSSKEFVSRVYESLALRGFSWATSKSFCATAVRMQTALYMNTRALMQTTAAWEQLLSAVL